MRQLKQLVKHHINELVRINASNDKYKEELLDLLAKELDFFINNVNKVRG